MCSTQVLDWFVQITLGLKHMHDRHILHRDLKLQNIFLTEFNTIKLGDFGLSKILELPGDFLDSKAGTPLYQSPEMCENKPYNSKSDMWSIGVLLYTLCALVQPFQAPTANLTIVKVLKTVPPSIPSHFSANVKDLVNRLLQKGMDDRPNCNDILKLDFIQTRISSFISMCEKPAARKVLFKTRSLENTLEGYVPRGDTEEEKAVVSFSLLCAFLYDPHVFKIISAHVHSQKAEEARRVAAEDAEAAAAEAKMWEEARKAKAALKAAREEKRKKAEQQALVDAAKAQPAAPAPIAVSVPSTVSLPAAVPAAGPTLDEIMALADEKDSARRVPSAPQAELTLEQIMAMADEQESARAGEGGVKTKGHLERVHTVPPQHAVQDDFHAYLKETYGSRKNSAEAATAVVTAPAAATPTTHAMDPQRLKALEEYVADYEMFVGRFECTHSCSHASSVPFYYQDACSK
jgi:hypothetical protein